MRNPRRKRNVAFFCFIAGASALVGLAALPDEALSGALATALGIVGITAAIFGLLGAIFMHGNARHQARLLKGSDVVARWRVDPERWRAFVALDDKLAGQPDVPPNGLSVRKTAPPAGVEVIVGQTALQVDGDFHALSKGSPILKGVTRRAGPPPCLEFDLLYQGGDSPDVRICLRFPIAAGAEAAAGRVQTHYNALMRATASRPSVAMRNPRRTRAAALAVAALSAAAFAGGLLLRDHQHLGLLPPLMAICGAVVGIAALVIALAVQLQIRGNRIQPR